jgi:hypothetical protein
MIKMRNEKKYKRLKKKQKENIAERPKRRIEHDIREKEAREERRISSLWRYRNLISGNIEDSEIVK